MCDFDLAVIAENIAPDAQKGPEKLRRQSGQCWDIIGGTWCACCELYAAQVLPLTWIKGKPHQSGGAVVIAFWLLIAGSARGRVEYII